MYFFKNRCIIENIVKKILISLTRRYLPMAEVKKQFFDCSIRRVYGLLIQLQYSHAEESQTGYTRYYYKLLTELYPETYNQFHCCHFCKRWNYDNLSDGEIRLVRVSRLYFNFGKDLTIDKLLSEHEEVIERVNSLYTLYKNLQIKPLFDY